MDLEAFSQPLPAPKVEIIWPEPLAYSEFEKQLIEKPHPLVDGILDSASRMIFGGGSKTYKTWVMSDLALSIVVGAPWWGFAGFQAPALYVNFELKDYYMQKRLRAIRKARSLQTGPLYILNLRGFEIALNAFIEMLLHEIDRHKILAVFIDPFYKLLAGRDERLSAEINQILAAFDRINRLTGATIIFAAHFTKGNQAYKEAIDRISGGGSINRDPDNLVTLTRHASEHAFTVEFTLRDFAPIAPFVVRWDYPLLVRDESLDPAEIKRPMGSTPQKSTKNNELSPDILLQLIPDDGDFQSTVVSKAKREFHKGSSVIFGWISELISEGKIIKTQIDSDKPQGGRPPFKLIHSRHP